MIKSHGQHRAAREGLRDLEILAVAFLVPIAGLLGVMFR